MGNVRSIVSNVHCDNLLTVAGGAGAANTTDINSQTLDCQEDGGGDTAVIEVFVGAIVATGTITLTMQEGDAADGSDAVDCASPAPIAITDTGGDELYILEKRDLTKKYVRVKIDKGTANSTILAVGGKLLGIREKPAAHNATVTTSQG